MLRAAALLFIWTSLSFGVLGITLTTQANDVAGKSFDYVIVGGGLSGLVVASRLAEVANITILVIEAGTDQRNNTLLNNPENWLGLSSSAYSWNITTVPQEVGGRRINVGQGRVLGGTSSINGMQFNRAHKHQYDGPELLGTPGWNFESLLGYMKKSEGFSIPNAQQSSGGATYAPDFRGTIGPLPVGYPVPYNSGKAFNDWLDTAARAIPGLTRLTDLGTGQNNGAGPNLYSIKAGPPGTTGQNIRSTSTLGYIYPFLDAKNGLTILMGHQVSGIVWGEDVNGKARAKGVGFVPTPAANAELPTPFNVEARREVILAAGSVGSPQILELSGIGNSTILRQAGVPLKIDLPSVGTNLQDHAVVTVAWNTASSVNAIDVDSTNTPGAGGCVLPNLEQTLGVEGAKAAAANLLASIPRRAQELVQSGGFSNLKGAEKMLMVQADSMINQKVPVVQIAIGVVNKNSAIRTALWPTMPLSRGTIHITSNRVSVRPRVDPTLLKDPLAMNITIGGIKVSRAVAAAAPFNKYLSDEVSPGSQLGPNATDDQFRSFIIDQFSTAWHLVGTVPLMPKEDGGAIDGNLLVYGTENVRVVDASTILLQLSANPSASVYGVAEKAADIIKKFI